MLRDDGVGLLISMRGGAEKDKKNRATIESMTTYLLER